MVIDEWYAMKAVQSLSIKPHVNIVALCWHGFSASGFDGAGTIAGNQIIAAAAVHIGIIVRWVLITFAVHPYVYLVLGIKA